MQAALIIVDIENTRRKTVKPFHSGVFSSAKGLKYILLKNNFWDDQQVGGLHKLRLMRFLGCVNLISGGLQRSIGSCKEQ